MTSSFRPVVATHHDEKLQARLVYQPVGGEDVECEGGSSDGEDAQLELEAAALEGYRPTPVRLILGDLHTCLPVFTPIAAHLWRVAAVEVDKCVV